MVGCVQVVPVAVDRAICEIITPVVERSVTIACMTTNELVLKDFAYEPDDVRLINVRYILNLKVLPSQPSWTMPLFYKSCCHQEGVGGGPAFLKTLYYVAV